MGHLQNGTTSGENGGSGGSGRKIKEMLCPAAGMLAGTVSSYIFGGGFVLHPGDMPKLEITLAQDKVKIGDTTIIIR